jgi:hypothetical protein
MKLKITTLSVEATFFAKNAKTQNPFAEIRKAD